MTICKRCAQNIIAKTAIEQPRPKQCVRCHCKLPPKNNSVSAYLVSRWLCETCKEFVIERQTGACFVCGRPLTARGYIALKQAQKEPSLRGEYKQTVQGRRVV